MVTDLVVVVVGGHSVETEEFRIHITCVGDDAVTKGAEVIRVNGQPVAEELRLNAGRDLLALLPGKVLVAKTLEGSLVGLVLCGAANPFKVSGSRAEVHSFFLKVLILIEIQRTERVVADDTGLSAQLEVVNPSGTFEEILLGHHPAKAERREHTVPLAFHKHTRAGCVHHSLHKVTVRMGIVGIQNHRVLTIPVGGLASLCCLKIIYRRGRKTVESPVSGIAQPLIEIKALMIPFAHRGLSRCLGSLVGCLGTLTCHRIINHSKIIRGLPYTVHIEDVKADIRFKFEPLGYLVHIPGQRTVDDSGTFPFSEESLLGQRGVRIAGVHLAQTVDPASSLGVESHVDRKSDRRSGVGYRKIIVKLVERAVVAETWATPEIQTGEQTYAELKVIGDLYVGIGTEIHLVVACGRARSIEITFAKIAEIDSILHRLRASLNRQIGFLVGLGVLEHQASPIHGRMDEVIRPVQGVGIYVILRVQDRITSSVSGLVLQGGIFGAAYIFRHPVNDTDSALDSDPDHLSGLQTTLGCDIENSFRRPCAEKRLVKDILHKSHRLNLLRIQLDFRKIDRLSIHNELGRQSSEIHSSTCPVRHQTCHSAGLSDDQSGNDTGQGISEVRGRVLVDVFLVKDGRAARGQGLAIIITVRKDKCLSHPMAGLRRDINSVRGRLAGRSGR